MKINKIELLKFIDKIIGGPLSLLLPEIQRNKELTHFEPQRILLIRPGGIGDAVLLLPVIRVLREKFPYSAIDILCEKRNADIFRLLPKIDEIYLYDRGLDLIRTVNNKYDVVIDTEQWHRLSAVVARLTGAPMRIGFDTNERKKLFTHRIPYSHDDYEIYSFFHLIEQLTGAAHDFDVNKPFVDISNNAGSLILAEIKTKDNLIALFPGASVPERRWGGEKFGKIARALTDRGYAIVILGSRAEISAGEKIRQYAADAVDLTGRTNLTEVAALLKMCKLLITADSGLLHIAYAVGTPTVSLFGSGIERKWAPPGKKHRVLNKHFPCSPCTRFGYTPRCKRNVECLSSISVDEILTTVEALLSE